VDRAAGGAGAADTRLADFAQRRLVIQHALELAELTIGLDHPGELGLNDRRILPPQPRLLKQKAAEVSELELAQPAQIAHPATDLAPLAHGFVALASSMPRVSIRPDQPVAVFDSGVGGLTVLHELLVSLPTEDYLYLGDAARFPYGERSVQELTQFSIEIADELIEAGAKLLVAACNSVSSAALGALEAYLADRGTGIDVIGVVAPATQLAVAGSRTGRIGLMATPTTVASGAYERAVAAADPHVHLESVACADLAPIIQGGFPFDEQMVETVREYCAPLRAADVDTVILGCTHYPLVAPMLQRILGRGVTLVTAGTGVARSVERALASRGLLNPQPDEGSYRFLCTADVDSFRTLGTRFLQMPLGAVVHVELRARAAA
jgi:glutamate racemase